jgi:hypothetical protein
MDPASRRYPLAEWSAGMTWRDHAKGVMREVEMELGPEATADQINAELRKRAHSFHCGASWLKQVWYEERRACLARHGAALPTSANERLLKAAGQGDIIFPFRGEKNSGGDQDVPDHG